MFLGLLATLALAIPGNGDTGLGVRFPLVPNLGQWETNAEFVGKFGSHSVWLKPSSLWMQRRERRGKDLVGQALCVEFLEANASARLSGRGPRGGPVTFLFGEEEANWRTAVPSFDSVLYSTLYPGVDLEVSVGKALNLLFRVESEEDLKRVAFDLLGTDESYIEDGGLLVPSEVGALRIEVSAQCNGVGLPVRLQRVRHSGFLSLARGAISSSPGQAEAASSTEAHLEWSSYLGGGGEDQVESVVVDDRGVITVCGQTGSLTFPTTPGPFTSYGGWFWDAFVSRIDPSIPGLVYSVLIGGVFDDRATDLALGASGKVYVCGETASANFPKTASAFQPGLGGQEDAFVFCLNAQGTGLVYSTYLGGTNGGEQARAIALEPGGEVTVVGDAKFGFPTTPGAFDENPKNLFVARLDSTGSSLVYSTFLGDAAGVGQVDEHLFDVASFGDGRVVVCGYTESTTYPTTSGVVSETNSSSGGVSIEDIVVTILAADGSLLEASTYMGGANNERAYAVAVGPEEDVFVGGVAGPGFPTTPGAFQTTTVGGADAIVARLSGSLEMLEYSTLMGGTQFDAELVWSLTVDASGVATASGWTNATDFPVTPGAFSESNERFLRDAFLTRLAPEGDRLFYSTYLGGTGFEFRTSLAPASHGSVVVAGFTGSLDFPLTPDALFAPSDTSEGFIAQLDMLPTGVRKIGESAESCRGEIFMSVTKMAEDGDATFGVTCSGAPPTAGAALSLGFGEFPGGGLVLPEFTYYLDVLKPIVVFFDDSDADGYAEFDLPLPPGTAGLEFTMQYIWVNTAGCGGLGTLSASNALGITIQ